MTKKKAGKIRAFFFSGYTALLYSFLVKSLTMAFATRALLALDTDPTHPQQIAITSQLQTRRRLTISIARKLQHASNSNT